MIISRYLDRSQSSILFGHMSEVRRGAWRGADCGVSAGAGGSAPQTPPLDQGAAPSPRAAFTFQ